MANDMLDVLNDIEISSGEIATPKEEVTAVFPEETNVPIGRLDYEALEKMAKEQTLWAVKNVGEEDLVCDWDLNLMPEELKESFDKYLSEKYNMFQIKEANLDFRIVALYRNGRTINFLHQFMTEKKIPSLETVYEGGIAEIKSQFVLPKGVTAIITQAQYESLKRFEKKRIVSASGSSDWSGFLVFKRLEPEKVRKIQYSFVTVQDIKNNGFEAVERDLQPIKKSATIEYSNELEEL